MNRTESVGVALVGCGTVGSGVARLLLRDAALLERRSGLRVELRHVVDKDFTRARQAGVDESLFRTSLDEALADERTRIVIELVGGTGFAKEIVQRALRARRDVVTANKALMALHGNELFALARANAVSIGLEASCVGGVPIIGALLNGLLANDIEAFYGIVNGTCNYILSKMARQGAGYAEVLAEAQRAGLAEADPTLDVKGIDSAHKLAILAALAFGQRIDFEGVHVEGIDQLSLTDIQYGQELGYTMKLLAIARRQGRSVSLRVHPAFISADQPLARIDGPFNAVSVYGHATGHTMYYGRGAGGLPTASAVVADVLDAAVGNARRRFEQLGVWPDRADEAPRLPIGQVRGRYYLRIMCQDRPGVLAKIAAELGDRGIGIASVLQHEPPEDEPASVPVVITTSSAVEDDLRQACGRIDELDVVNAPTVRIRIVEEYEEPPL